MTSVVHILLKVSAPFPLSVSHAYTHSACVIEDFLRESSYWLSPSQQPKFSQIFPLLVNIAGFIACPEIIYTILLWSYTSFQEILSKKSKAVMEETLNSQNHHRVMDLPSPSPSWQGSQTEWPTLKLWLLPSQLKTIYHYQQFQSSFSFHR